MKRIQYKYMYAEINHGTEEEPDIEQAFVDKDIPYSEESLIHAKEEAYNGEYEIYDEGIEATTEPTQEERIQELEEALELLLSGVTQ